MNEPSRVTAAFTVTVDDETLSLTTDEGEETTTELDGPGVAGELRVRVGRVGPVRDGVDAERETPDERAVDDPTSGDEAVTSGDATDSNDAGSPTTGGERSKARFEVYEDRAGEFRWRLVHANGNVIADSGEGYATWRGAENGLRSVKENAADAAVERL